MLTASVRDTVIRTGWATVVLPWTQGERVLIVATPAMVETAKKQNPGLVDYLLEEFDIIDPQEMDFTALRNIHLVKKHVGGRVCKRLPPGV